MSKNKITAVLGPTNTGKTFLAIETMLSFDTGMIGFPLRLLAREVYDKVMKKTGVDKLLAECFPHAKIDEIEALKVINDVDGFKKLARQQGWTDKEIKEIGK